MKKIDIFVIDFDSTFVKYESINLIIDLALKAYARKKDAYKKLKILSELCMKSEISFKDNFKMKIEIIKKALTEEHLKRVGVYLKQNISPDIIKIIDKAKALNKKIIVVSNSFKAVMKDTMEQYGIDIYFANKHIADKDGYVIGFDESNPLANDNGKENIIMFLKNAGVIQPDEKIIMIGDGIPDLKVYKSGAVNYFLCFAINESRKIHKHRVDGDENFIVCKESKDVDAFVEEII